jgi:hypothetical protein
MTQEQRAEGNLSIAKFCLYHYQSDEGIVSIANDDDKLHYHSSWDWQIPAWSKVTTLLKESTRKDGNHVEFYYSQLEEYEKAVVNNKPEYGFCVLVKSIEYYNKHK